MNKGVFCISIDLELLWGRKDRNWQEFASRTEKERSIVRKILDLFAKYDIPATWAVVGKILEKGTPLWSGKDIVRLIKSYPNQEIGSHAYSHEIFTEIDYQKAKDEIAKLVIAFEKESIHLSSFVFPRNKVKYIDLLKKYGFKTFRGPDRRNWELLFPALPPVYQPIKMAGLVNVPGSMYFVSARGMRKYLPSGLRFIKSWLGIKRAIKEKRVYHLWFHPVDFADKEDSLFKELTAILKYANRQRKLNRLEIKNMEEIADEKLME